MITEIEKKAIIEFASDISSNDNDTLKTINAIFDPIVKEPETVGFYLSGDESDFDIASLTMITQLVNDGFIYAYSDKYLHEMPDLLLNSPRFKQQLVISKKARQFINDLSHQIGNDFEHAESVALDYFQELEAAANENGIYYLSLERNSGDSQFIAEVSKHIYEKWLNIHFQDESNTSNRMDVNIEIMNIQWVLIWDYIADIIYEERSEIEYQAPTLRPLTSLFTQ